MYRVVIFDFDGVLGDSEGINISAVTKTLLELGIRLTTKELERIPGRASGDIIPEILGARGYRPERFQPTIDLVRLNYDAIWDSCFKLMPDVPEVIAHLTARNIKLGIGTTNRRAVIDRFLKRYRFEGTFDHIVTGEMVTEKKPSPEVYLLLAEAFEVPKHEILIIEDAGPGGAAATASGIPWAAIPTPHTAAHNFTGASLVLKRLAEIIPFFP